MANRETEEKAGSEYGTVKTIRLRADDVERLRALTQVLGASEAAVIRMALRELARKEGVGASGSE